MFHVPEKYRVIAGPGASNPTYGNNGRFLVPFSRRVLLVMIASDGMAWDHVSVHAEEMGRDRTPSWDEMCAIKDLFWDAEDVVMQLHPAKSEYINVHPHVLHLWRPQDAWIPVPPRIMV